MFKDYYQILEVSRDASQPEIKKSYRKLAKAHHPDSNLRMDEGDQFLLINEAYQTLSDSISRESYNTRYDKISQIRRTAKTRKQASANVYKEAYADPFRETYQETYSPPPQEEYVNEDDYSHNYSEPSEREYSAPRAETYSRPAPKKSQSINYKKLTWLGRTISVLCLLFGGSIGADYFLAEASEVQTMIEARLTTGADDKLNCTIITDKSEFPIAYQKYGYLGKGDQLILYTTPIYKVMSAIQIVDGDNIWPHTGIYNSFSVFLFLLILASVVGIFIKRPEFVFRIGIANILLAILTALILLRS